MTAQLKDQDQNLDDLLQEGVRDLDMRFIGRFSSLYYAVSHIWNTLRIPNCEEKLGGFHELPTNDLEIDYAQTLTTLCKNYGVRCVEHKDEYWLFSSQQSDASFSLEDKYGRPVLSAMEKLYLDGGDGNDDID
jgi:hypothetical protein|tara:strand:- start:53 stop:451 length:399 start_codon:yes stop_codon:yes gene_type:complete